MSLQQLMAEVSTLSDQERRELIGYMLSLGRKRSKDYWDRLEAKVEDKDPSHWVPGDELERALGLDRPEQ